MKKVYDRKSKKYVTEEELQKGSLKKREKCKGNRPHDWVEVLPYGVEALPHYTGSPLPYYEAEDAIATYTERVYKTLAKEHGIDVRRYSSIFRPRMGHFLCSTCGKKDYK